MVRLSETPLPAETSLNAVAVEKQLKFRSRPKLTLLARTRLCVHHKLTFRTRLYLDKMLTGYPDRDTKPHNSWLTTAPLLIRQE